MCVLIKPEAMSIIYGKVITWHSVERDEELRSLAINLTSNCIDYVGYCQLGRIVNYLNEFDYVNSADGYIYPVKETIKNKAGDCDDLSYVFSSLISQLGIKSKVVCTIGHCWNEIELSDNSNFFYDPANKNFVRLK